MMTTRLAPLFALVAGMCQAQPAPANAEAVVIKKLLKKGLSHGFGKGQEAVVERLVKNARFSPGLAVANGEEGGKTIVACAKRTAAILGDNQKKALIRPILAAEVIRYRASRTPKLQAALKPFKYGHLLYDELGVRLLSRVKGTLFGLGENTTFLTGQNHVVGVVFLKPEQVELKAVEMLSQEEMRPLYRTAVIRQLKANIFRKKYKEALPLLRETKKYGYDKTKEFYIDLYHCFLFTGKPDQMAQISRVMVQQYGVELIDDDCRALAALATNAKQVKEADFWNLEAKKRSTFTLESILEELNPKVDPQGAPKQDPKNPPKDKPKASPKKKKQ